MTVRLYLARLAAICASALLVALPALSTGMPGCAHHGVEAGTHARAPMAVEGASCHEAPSAGSAQAAGHAPEDGQCPGCEGACGCDATGAGSALELSTRALHGHGVGVALERGIDVLAARDLSLTGWARGPPTTDP